MAILDDYVEKLMADKMAPTDAYLELQRALKPYERPEAEKDDRDWEMWHAFTFFAHLLAGLYLTEQGLTLDHEQGEDDGTRMDKKRA